jgi:hypothetical protein
MLETELKKLNANIEKLVAAIEGIAPVKDAVYELNATLEAQGPETSTHSGKSVKDVVEEAVNKKTEEPEVEETETEDSAFTNDDIKSMALAISRKDRSKQRDIKAKLAEHDAKVATDLKGDGLQAVGEWLQALKEELGA